MTQVYLIRHAEAEGNLYRRVHGWYDSLITDNGYRQIAALEKRFRDIHIDAVYSSDLFRTKTTAEAVCKPKGLALRTDVGLREVHMGWWEDHPWAELARTDGETLALFNANSPAWKVPGGESFEQVRIRVGETVKKLAARHDGQTIALFSHGAAIRNTLAWFEGLSVADSADRPYGVNTAVSLLELDGDSARVVFKDDSSHLSPDLIPQKLHVEDAALKEAWMRELWYRPLDFFSESELYYQARKDAWTAVHGTLEHFDGDGFLRDARNLSRRDPTCVMCAMRGDQAAGILQIDIGRDADLGVGYIPFYYMLPEFRSHGLGVQLLGHAVSVFRPLGRDRLRLRCAPENEAGQRFYRRHGFYPVDQDPGRLGVLDVLEKYIGYEKR